MCVCVCPRDLTFMVKYSNTGVEVDVEKLDLKDISNKLMDVLDPDDTKSFREIFYDGA